MKQYDSRKLPGMGVTLLLSTAEASVCRVRGVLWLETTASSSCADVGSYLGISRNRNELTFGTISNLMLTCHVFIAFQCFFKFSINTHVCVGRNKAHRAPKGPKPFAKQNQKNQSKHNWQKFPFELGSFELSSFF